MRLGKDGSTWDYAPLALLYVAFLYMSKMWTPNFLDMESGDYSLMFINHYIFPRAADLAGLGTNTTGRWSILIWNLYWPETYWLHVLGHVFIATVVFLFLQTWLGAERCAAWIKALLAVILALALARSVDIRFLVLAALVPMALPDLRRRRTSVLLIVLLSAVALAAHVKGTFLLAAIATFGFLLGIELLNRRLPLNATALLVAFLGWMTVADIPWIDAWRLFTLVLASGGTYGELFSGPLSPLLSALVIAGMAGTGLLIVIGNARNGPAGYLHIGFWAVLLFLVFKTSAVLPTGQHYIRWIVFLIAIGILFAARHWDHVGPAVHRALQYRPLRLVLPLLAVVMAGAALLPEARAELQRKVEEKREFMSYEFRHLGAMARSIVGGRDLEERHRMAVQRVRENTPLPALTGPVGVYVSAFATIPMAHDFLLRPLPTLNLDEGWTRRAIRENAAYLAGPSAPPYMLVRADAAVNNVTLAIFEHYAPLSVHDSVLPGDASSGPPHSAFVLLGRREPGSRVERRLAGEVTVRWDELAAVPAIANDEILVAEYEYHKTLLARLLGFAFRPPLASMEILDTAGQIIRRRRLAAEVGPDGEIVSPYFSGTTQQLAAAAQWRDDGQDRGPVADRIRFVAGHESEPDWLYGPSYRHWFAPTISVHFRILRLVTAS